MEREMRTVADSRVEQIQIVMPEHINGYGRLFRRPARRVD